MRHIFKPNFVKNIKNNFICLFFETYFSRNLTLTLNSNTVKAFIYRVTINDLRDTLMPGYGYLRCQTIFLK